MEVRGNTIATVIRRVGGLEAHSGGPLRPAGVIRRVGGLEETAGLRFGSRNVIRRVGGLEEHPATPAGALMLSAV